jgi:hypothetical protein
MFGGRRRSHMLVTLAIALVLSGTGNTMQVDVSAPQYSVVEDGIQFEEATYTHPPGAPDLPCRTVTIALPPGAVVQSVGFSGSRHELTTAEIPPVGPPLPMTNEREALGRAYGVYEARRSRLYSTDEMYPATYGTVVSKGGLRKYTLVTVACYHFAYRPLSGRLLYSPSITIQIEYRISDAGTDRARFWEELRNDVTFDHLARHLIYNWEEAQEWYAADTPQLADGYTIIVPASLVSAVDSLAVYRQNQGYNVSVVTTEFIQSNVDGIDLPQKIRNYLREEMSNTQYVLLVGFYTDMPWRSVVPFNDDPDSPYNDPSITPIPTDLYYADLTEPDSLSWDYDRDAYYGEVYDSTFAPAGDDSPDYHADVHLARIPYSTAPMIRDICEKTKAFDSNTDMSYKGASLLAGGLIYFENENYSGYPRYDGADMMEKALNDTVLDRGNAVTLYEKSGLRPSPFSCTAPLTRENMIFYWQRKGIVLEYNHGAPDGYWRKVWAWDDGDSVAESSEITWPLCLYASDAMSLDNDYPATTFLRSCSCGKPESQGLAAQLLNRGSSVVFGSSRVLWVGPQNDAGLAYYFVKSLMKDLALSGGIVGNAFSLGRVAFMDETGFWMNTYLVNMYGDPALRQFGAIVGVAEAEEKISHSSFEVFPNPTSGRISVRFGPLPEGVLEISVYDVAGRFVRCLYRGIAANESRTVELNLPTGIYFLSLKNQGSSTFKKVTLVN